MARVTIVPTPVGNLEDITLRALRVLKEASFVAAEDTRTSSVLLKHFEIRTPLTALHMHNEHHKVAALLERVVQEDLHLAVISDAGTPGISDPGYLVVREALKREIPLEVLPGPTALIPALVGSGLPCDDFRFIGFLPVKKGRQTQLREISALPYTIVMYESPFRVLRTLQDLSEHCGMERPVAVVREISKKFETYVRGTLADAVQHFNTHEPKGEFVVVLGGTP